MTQPDTLQAARSGNPTAIATLLNHSFNPQGIQVRAIVRDGSLQILLESDPFPDLPTSLKTLQQELTALAIPLLHPTKVYGRKLGEKQPAWMRDLQIPPIHVDVPKQQQSTPPTLTTSEGQLRKQSHPFYGTNNGTRPTPLQRQSVPLSPVAKKTATRPNKSAPPSRAAKKQTKTFMFLPVLLLLQVAGLIGLIFWIRSQVKPLPATAINRSKQMSRSTTIDRSLTPTNLATYLNQQKAVMYGTYWCGACSWQKEQFGSEAFALIRYVECDPGGSNAQPDLCRQEGINVYPTWKIPTPSGVKVVEGGYDLVGLAEMSGFSSIQSSR